jgi:2-oxoglutarate ferredoxin oxidoreductase subunit alpha
MSPATGVIRNLTAMTEKIPFVVEQAEDEIAAVNMIVGASFAGVRAMTSTSGGGFCLMTEGLGLAGITEIPIVIVNAQRPGPATGLPTRTAQGDLLFVINASQDEFPRFVFAPRSVDEAFSLTILAFELAEKYQVPAIVLTDQFLNDSVFLTREKFIAPERPARFIATDEDLKNPENYLRFAVTDTGVSPRALPCRGKAIVTTSGNEHLEDGHISEDKDNRTRMVDKRNTKLAAMTAELDGPEGYFEDADLIIIGWGSSAGAVKEAVELLREKDINVGCLTFSHIWPFPVEKIKTAVRHAKKCVTVELNATAQFKRLLRQEAGIECAGAILKYDGRPLLPGDIIDKIDNFV